jgi:preprotein translocase subunit SecE
VSSEVAEKDMLLQVVGELFEQAGREWRQVTWVVRRQHR